MRIAAAAAVLVLLAAAPAWAQSLVLSTKDPDRPIEINAPGDVEWQRNDNRFIARGDETGDARATQAEVSVSARELVAHYRSTPGGGTEFYRVDAVGNVVIASATETATADAAVYDFDKAVLVLEGEAVSLKTATGTVTAREALQYWANERVAVADGDAVATENQRSIRADRLTAFFNGTQPGGGGSGDSLMNLERGDITFLQALGNVRLQTANAVVLADRGNYNIETGIATLDGSVKITQNNNQLSGGFAVVNVKAGTSRIFGSAGEAGMQAPREDGRVSALIAPQPLKEPVGTARPAAQGGGQAP